MCKLLVRLWQEDGGALISVEWVFVATILVLGGIIGLVAVRNAVNAELATFGNAVLSLQNCFSISGQTLSCTMANGMPCDPGGAGGNGVSAGTCGSNTGAETPSHETITSTIPTAGTPITVTPCQ